jgi:hypothetical protein
MHLVQTQRLILVVLAVVATVVAASLASAHAPIMRTDLKAPRGLSGDGSYLLVADQGNGRILRVSEEGSTGVLTQGIVAAIDQTPQGAQQVGVSGVIGVGDTYFYVTGGLLEPGSAEPGFQSVYSVRAGQSPVLLADLGAYERAHNTDGDTGPTGDPVLESNPYDLVADGAGGLYVSDSAANAVLHVSAMGEISPFAVFRDRPNPLFPKVGGPTLDQVPTGIETGPDGVIYVSTLTGFPFPKGMARVYRLQDTNGDGDALDDGEATIYADGLTSATNLAFDRDGSLLVTEFSTDMLKQAPGRLVRVVEGSIGEVVKAPLISPTGVAVLPDGRIVVSEEFLGTVAELDALPAGPGVSPSGPPITPPNTGSGGLKH